MSATWSLSRGVPGMMRPPTRLNGHAFGVVLLRRRRFSDMACSTLIRGVRDAEAAALQAVDALSPRLGNGSHLNLTLWFANGYGQRAAPIGRIFQERLAFDGVVVGSSSEGGVIGSGAEVQHDETFALTVLTLRMPGVRIFPFRTTTSTVLPDLGRGGSWEEVRASAVSASVLAFRSVQPTCQVNIRDWLSLLDAALLTDATDARRKTLPTVVGGLTVGTYVFLDGVQYDGGAFGVVMLPDDADAISFVPLVCQGAVPFGPILQITGVTEGHIITSLDGKNPKAVLEPLLQGPQVPGTGHTMAGVFVETDVDGPHGAAPSAQSSCLIRPVHNFTHEGNVVVSPVYDDMPYVPGMHFQLHCMSAELALEDLRMRAGHDVMDHGFSPPDAAIIISCGARGVNLHKSEGVESGVLRQAWGCDVPTVGFFAGGEFGRVGSKTYMHGFTTSCLLLRQPSS